MSAYSREEMEEMMKRWIAVNDKAEQEGNWRHLADFFQPHAVFTGDAATCFHAQFQNRRAEGLGPFEFTRDIGIEQNQGMEVAVAGVEYIGYPQIVFFRHSLHFSQHLGEMLAGNGAVHAVVIR